MKPTKTLDTLNSVVKAVVDQYGDLENRLVSFVRERDEALRERDALRAQLQVLEVRLQNIARQRQLKKTFRVYVPSLRTDKLDAVRRQRTQTLKQPDPRKVKITSSEPLDQPTWNLLIKEAARLIREYYARIPVTRSVHEWNLAADNLKNNKPERHEFRWTRSEEEKLVADFRAHRSLAHLIHMHKREPEAIALRLAKLTNNADLTQLRYQVSFLVTRRNAIETDDQYATRMLKWFFQGGNNRRLRSTLDRKEIVINFTNYTGA